MGIEQLVEAYKGNPQPLQAKVQQAQKGQPPGAIPPDLEEAIALQKISELRNSAQGQQAIQAGGAQPSVVEKLRQMLAGAEQRQQGQPPEMPQGMPQGQPQIPPQMPSQMPQGQPPVMAARGGSISQLMSNLGRHYAGGGIVAFNEGNEVKDPEVEKKLQQYTLQQQGADYVARKQAAREAQIKAALEEEARRQAMISQIPTEGQEAPASTGPMPGEFQRNITNTLSALPGASAARGFAGGIRGLLASLVGMEDQKEKPAQVKTTPVPGAPLDSESEKLIRLAAAQGQTGVNTNPNLVPRKPVVGTSPDDAKPRPSAGIAGGGGGSGGSKQAFLIDELVKQGLITKPGGDAAYKKMAGVMNMDADTEETKAINKFKQQVGEKDLSIYDQMAQELKARKERLNAPKPGFDSLMEYLGQIAQSGGGRNWMESGTKGAAGLSALQKSRQDQQDALVDKILDLGAKKKEAEYAQKEKMYDIGQARYKDVFKNAFEAAKEVNKSDDEARKIAIEAVLKQKELDDRAATRAQSARQHSDNQALALEERKRQFNEEQLRKMREKDVDRANKIEAAIGKRVGNIDLQLQSSKLKPEVEADLLRRRNEIVKQVQAEYPPIKPEKPSMDQFLTAARKANPGVSDADLKAYYNKTYGS